MKADRQVYIRLDRNRTSIKCNVACPIETSIFAIELPTDSCAGKIDLTRRVKAVAKENIPTDGHPITIQSDAFDCVEPSAIARKLSRDLCSGDINRTD